MDKIWEIRKSINHIKAFLAGVLKKHVKDKKRFWSELGAKNKIIKLLIDNFKQLAEFISKSNTNLLLLQTSDFSENDSFISTQRNEH